MLDQPDPHRDVGVEVVIKLRQNVEAKRRQDESSVSFCFVS
jgi:hypothetical protein